METIGARVKRLRTQRNWTQGALAEIIHVAENYVGAVERDVRNPSDKLVARLAEAFGVEEAVIKYGERTGDKDLQELFAEIEAVYEDAKATSSADRYEFMAALTRAVAAHKREPQRDR